MIYNKKEHLEYILNIYGFLLPVYSSKISNIEFAELVSSYYDTENKKTMYNVEFLKKCYGYSFQRNGSSITISYQDKFIEDEQKKQIMNYDWEYNK